MAIAGSGGWKPSVACRLNYRGELALVSIAQNKPPYIVESDIAAAVARLRRGETVEVLFYGDSIPTLRRALETTE